MAFASEWFRHYPALTISLYPLIFPVVEAIVFAIFGFSHDTAQATVTLFAILRGYGVCQFVRPAAGAMAGTYAVILLFATPLMLLWSRQIIMEVPALSFLLLAAAALLQYQAKNRTKDLFAAVLLTLAPSTPNRRRYSWRPPSRWHFSRTPGFRCCAANTSG